MKLNLLTTCLSSVALLTINALIFAPNASAQTAQKQDRASAQLDEIIVTARKKSESLQDAPIAISAYTGEALEYKGVTNLEEIAKFVPNLNLQNNPSFSGASNSAAIYLRGVGQKEFLPTTDPGVGLYVDDVYIARSVGAILDLIDVERVEILRGPQGTLFGRNTIGGAIALTTKKPNQDAGGRIGLTYGTDNRLNLKASYNLPITETLSARLSAGVFKQDGYVERDDGIDLGNDNTLASRLSFNYDSTDGDLEIDVAFDYTKDSENGPALQLIAIDHTDLSQLLPAFAALNAREGANNPNYIPVGPPPPMVFVHNVTAGATAPGVPCAIVVANVVNVTSNPAAPNCYDTRYIRDDDGNSGTAPAYSNSETFGASLTAKFRINDNLSLKSITAYRELDSEFARDGDHSPFRIAQFSDVLSQSQFTQEFQLLGNHFDNRLDWIIGAYYFKEDGRNTNTLDFTVSKFQSGGDFGDENFAVFAQGTYDLTDRLHVTLGGRYTDESKTFTPDQFIITNYFAGISNILPAGHPLAALDAPFLQAGGRVLPHVEAKTSISEFSPMANIAYDVTDNVMVYTSYSEGFKSGGFTQRVFPPIIPPYTAAPGTQPVDLIPGYEPEFVKVMEVGFKAKLFDNRLRLNAAAFDTSYDDLQVQVFTSVAPVTKNAGQASIQGLEIEAQLAPGNGWFLEANFSLLDAKYDVIDPLSTFVDPNNKFERVPETSAGIGASKEFQFTNSSLTPRVDITYRGAFFNDAFNTPIIESKSLTLVDASMTWRTDDDGLSVALGVKNLTNEKYLANGVYGLAFQIFEGTYDRGTQWYVSVNKNF